MIALVVENSVTCNVKLFDVDGTAMYSEDGFEASCVNARSINVAPSLRSRESDCVLEHV